MGSGPALVGYDGSPAAKQALREAIDLLGPVPMLVVMIWEAGLPFELVAAPTIDPKPSWAVRPASSSGAHPAPCSSFATKPSPPDPGAFESVPCIRCDTAQR